MKKYIIYQIKNEINGKLYIGQYSGEKFNKYYGSGILIKRAILKHGKDNFTKTILEECDNKSELNTSEIYWIYIKNTINEGYNLHKGGTGGDTSKFIKYDGKWKNEVSKSVKEYWDNLSDEQRLERCITVSGENNGMFGKIGYWKDKKIPQDIIDKMIKNRRSFIGEENPNWKGGISVKYCKCGKQINTTNDTCNKCRNRSGEENPFFGKKHSQETIEKLRENAKNRTKKPSNSKKINIDGKIYESMGDVAREYNIDRSLVTYRCKSKKYNWKIIDE